MSVEDTLVDHLRVLGKTSTWKLPQLPDPITDDVLRCLDDRGWIQVRVLKSMPRGAPEKVRPWFSPLQYDDIDWDDILRKYREATAENREMYCEVQVSEQGRARLAEASLSEAKSQDPGLPKRIGVWVWKNIVLRIIVILLGAALRQEPAVDGLPAFSA